MSGSEFSDWDGFNTTSFSSSTTLSIPEDHRFKTCQLVQTSPNPYDRIRHFHREKYSPLRNEVSDNSKRFPVRNANRIKRIRSNQRKYHHKNESVMMVPQRRARTSSCGMLTLFWKQFQDKNSLRFKLWKVKIGPEVVGYFVKFQISHEDSHQEIEAHYEDLFSTEHMAVFREFSLDYDSELAIGIKVQNLRRSLTYQGSLNLLTSEAGDHSQIVNLFIVKVNIVEKYQMK